MLRFISKMEDLAEILVIKFKRRISLFWNVVIQPAAAFEAKNV